jgi:hypothetical protein
MDKTTRLALRAIVRGLHRDEALTEEQIVSVVGELYSSADEHRAWKHGVDAGDLDKLATEIGRDAGISST